MARVYRYSHDSFWARRGFLPEEREYLTRISPRGRRAPYILRMRRVRVSLNANRIKYGWNIEEYRRRVLAQYVAVLGRSPRPGETIASFIDRVFWDYFTWFKDTTPLDPDWETPKIVRYMRVVGDTKRQAGKRQMLIKRIQDLNADISRAALAQDQRRRRELEMMRNEAQNELDFLG